jgi:hypothetical protein
VVEKLEQARRLLVNRSGLIVNVTLDAANWSRFEPQLHDFIAALPTGPLHLHTWTPAFDPTHEGLTIPAQVNYVGKGANLYSLGYELHGSIHAIANFLRTSWLWDKVRVQGGAYGGSCRFSPQSGGFTYLSYRDPNLLDTLKVYDQTPHFLRQMDLSDDELTRSIIGAISTLDAYQLPDAKGYTSLARYLTHERDEDRQRIRDQVFSTTVADFRAFADVLAEVNGQGRVVIMGAQEALVAANEAYGENWLKLQKVL